MKPILDAAIRWHGAWRFRAVKIRRVVDGCLRVLLCGVLLAGGSSNAWGQSWTPGRSLGATPASYALQAVPCEDCDAAVSTNLPPLPGLEAYTETELGTGEYATEAYDDGYHASYDSASYDSAAAVTEPWFPNRPHVVPRTLSRLRQRPLFPNRPHLMGTWTGGPPLERPRSVWFNPFAIQQGMGNWLFRGNHPTDTGSLGFPFSLVPSHLADRVPRPYLGYGQPAIQSPHIGMGQPLSGTSWTNRPFSVDVFSGAFLANKLNENIDQGNGLITGFRLGWDFDYYWGTEFRMGFGNTRVDGSSEKVDVRLGDLSVLYYPWGDSRWRPYTGLGLGLGNFAFQDGSLAVDDYALQVPISVGMKYAFKPWWNLRLDFTNFLSMPSSNLDFMNNVQLTGALEYRFGGRRRSYFPYNPSIHLK